MACWADDIPPKDFLEIKVIKITYYSAARSSRLHSVNHHRNCGGAGVIRGMIANGGKYGNTQSRVEGQEAPSPLLQLLETGAGAAAELQVQQRRVPAGRSDPNGNGKRLSQTP